MLKAYQTRWNKLRHFTFDDGTATDSFAQKTTSSQNWTTAFTARALSEYKKFLLLCSVSPTGAAPPQIVDKTWPPTDIWPPPGKKIPPIKAPPFTWSTKISIAFTAYLLLTFAFCIFVFRQPTSYFINGPEFIFFFAVYTACILPALSRYLQHKLKQTELNAICWFPEDASHFQSAQCCSGEHRASDNRQNGHGRSHSAVSSSCESSCAGGEGCGDGKTDEYEKNNKLHYLNNVT